MLNVDLTPQAKGYTRLRKSTQTERKNWKVTSILIFPQLYLGITDKYLYVFRVNNVMF